MSNTSDKIQYDVVLVGGSPSNFALAHRLVDLAIENGTSFTMAILEKGKSFGSHVMSGAVSNPHVIQKLFPNHREEGFPIEGVCSESNFLVLGQEKQWSVPRMAQPPGLHKEGYYILSLSHVVYWMASKLKEKVKDHPNILIDLYPGFAAHEVLFEGDRVIGVQVEEAVSDNPDEERVYGKVTCFGDKGFVSRDVIDKFQLRENPQVWSVGVKEVWQLPESFNLEGQVWHTMGYPLVDGAFGGGFVYGMKDNKLTIGLVISLDAENPNLNPQQRLQDFKKHPWLQKLLKDASMLKYGAALLPEGGYYSLPKKYQVDGAIFLGDALGILNVSTLAGVDKAMESGCLAAEVIHEALKKDDTSEAALSEYQQKVDASFIIEDLKAGRYFRQAWQENPRLLNTYLPAVMDAIDDTGNPFTGFMKIGLEHPIASIQDALRLKTMLDGNKDMGPVSYKPDYQHIKPNFEAPRAIRVHTFEKSTYYSREDAVFYANPRYHEENAHIDEFNSDTCLTCIEKYDSLKKETPCVSDCTAEVHRVDVVQDLRKHGMSLENCIQCRTCEIVCPEVNLRVKPAAQGSGPDFMGL